MYLNVYDGIYRDGFASTVAIKLDTSKLTKLVYKYKNPKLATAHLTGIEANVTHFEALKPLYSERCHINLNVIFDYDSFLDFDDVEMYTPKFTI